MEGLIQAEEITKQVETYLYELNRQSKTHQKNNLKKPASFLHLLRLL